MKGFPHLVQFLDGNCPAKSLLISSVVQVFLSASSCLFNFNSSDCNQSLTCIEAGFLKSFSKTLVAIILDDSSKSTSPFLNRSNRIRSSEVNSLELDLLFKCFLKCPAIDCSNKCKSQSKLSKYCFATSLNSCP